MTAHPSRSRRFVSHLLARSLARCARARLLPCFRLPRRLSLSLSLSLSLGPEHWISYGSYGEVSEAERNEAFLLSFSFSCPLHPASTPQSRPPRRRPCCRSSVHSLSALLRPLPLSICDSSSSSFFTILMLSRARAAAADSLSPCTVCSARDRHRAEPQRQLPLALTKVCSKRDCTLLMSHVSFLFFGQLWPCTPTQVHPLFQIGQSGPSDSNVIFCHVVHISPWILVL